MKCKKNSQLEIKNLNFFASFTQFGWIPKAFIILLFAVFTASSIQAQEEEAFNRKGRWLVETGYNIVSGITGGGTGLSFIINEDGDNITSFGAEIGKFTSQNFALKLKFGILSASGLSISNFAVGAKYYIGGSVPLDIGLGTLNSNSFGQSQIQGTIHVGYALNLASNVALEPSLGAIITEDGVLISFRIGFAMFL